MTSLAPEHVHLDALTRADFDTVACLGGVIWRAHYIRLISLEQIDYMLSDRYTPDKLELYLNASERWLDLLRLGDRPVGYCSYALTPRPGEMKLEQLYLLPELHGKGLGGLMLRHVEVQARARGCTKLMLQVNKRNLDAIAIYRKFGFCVREEAVFDIGNGFVMDDYLMEKTLSP